MLAKGGFEQGKEEHYGTPASPREAAFEVALTAPGCAHGATSSPCPSVTRPPRHQPLPVSTGSRSLAGEGAAAGQGEGVVGKGQDPLAPQLVAHLSDFGGSRGVEFPGSTNKEKKLRGLGGAVLRSDRECWVSPLEARTHVQLVEMKSQGERRVMLSRGTHQGLCHRGTRESWG